MDNRNGFVLVMILALIVLAALLLTSLAGKSIRLANSARETEHLLQCKWLALSGERSILQSAANLFSNMNFEDFPNDDRCRRGPTLSATLNLGRYSVDLVVADEQSKVNLNHLQNTSGSTTVRSAVIDALDCAPRPHPVIDLRPYRVARDKENAITAYASWSQVFGLSDFRPKEALGVLHTSRCLTLWGDGRINIRRAHDEDLRRALSKVLGSREVEQLIQMRRELEEDRELEEEVEEIELTKMVDQLELNEQQRQQILTVITDKSNCFSLWTVIRAGSREYYQLGIIHKVEQDAAQTNAAQTNATQANATPADRLPGTESELQPVRHFLW